MSEPAKNFIRLRNGLKQIDENTLELRSRLTKIAKNQDKILKIDSEIERKKISIAKALNSPVSDLEEEGKISVIVQNLKEQINFSIQSQQDAISKSHDASIIFQEELSNYEAELDSLIETNWRDAKNRFLKFTVLYWPIALGVGWNETANLVGGTVKLIVGNVIGIIGIFWLFYAMVFLSYVATRVSPSTEKEKREAVIHVERARLITTQIDDTRARIKGRKRSVKSRQKNIANYEMELKELEYALKTHDSIKKSQKSLAILREEIALLATAVVELEKENAEVWTSISDLIPSEFH